jgi:Fe-S cluster assembly protein SufD
MTDLLSKPNSLIANFALVRDLLAATGPAEWQPRREAALASFERAGVPTARDEEFKYLPLRRLEAETFAPAYGATVGREEVSRTALGDIDAITLAFVNGEFAPELSSTDVLPEGVFVGTLAEALSALPEAATSLGTIATYEGKLGSTNDPRFIDLNTAYLGEGAVVSIPRGVALERPVHLRYIVKADHGPIAVYPRVLILLGENAQARIVESYAGLEGTAFVNGVTEIDLGENAWLELTRFQSETSTSIHISNTAAAQATGSTFIHTSANFGGAIVRNDVNVWGGGEHTETSLNSANLGADEQVVDNHTRIDHATPNCHSFETYKSILRDRSVGVFNGKIFVYEDAQKTDAKQTNQAILLSPTATMNTKPQLEIFADDVKCTHGATIGQLREDALFYLRARGIPKAQAQALLVYAFAAEVLEKITVEPVRDALERELFRKLEETEALPTGD